LHDAAGSQTSNEKKIHEIEAKNKDFRVWIGGPVGYFW
jgi:hypothetical protein